MFQKWRLLKIRCYWSVHCDLALVQEGDTVKSMMKPAHKGEKVGPIGQFIALRAFNALKEALFWYVLILCTLISDLLIDETKSNNENKFEGEAYILSRRSKWGVLGTPLSNFFHFHSVFSINLLTNKLALPPQAMTPRLGNPGSATRLLTTIISCKDPS